MVDCCELITDGDHQPPPKSESGVPFITISDIDAYNTITYEKVAFAPTEYYCSLKDDRKARKGDVLYSVVGTYGKPVFKRSDAPIVFQRHIALLRANDKVLPAFLYYSLLNRDFYCRADAVAIGAAQKTITLNALRNLQIPLPNLETQERIVRMLEPYDALIENNRRQIKLLEEAAQRLYKEWFVDLRFPGHEHTPIIDGVPQGWNTCVFADLIQKEIGGGWGKEKEEGKYDMPAYVIRGTDLENISTGDYIVPHRYHSRNNFESRKLRMGDIIFEVSGGGKNEGVAKTLRITSGMLRKWDERAICASFCKLVRLRSEVLSCYVGDALKYLRATRQTEIYDKRSASSIVNFRWADFLREQRFIIPEKSIMQQYYEASNALYERQVAMALSISSASEARDRLLPKLMSGEIEVSAQP